MDLSSPEMQQLIASVALLLISTIVSLLSKVSYTFIKTKTSAQQFAILEQIADSAVNTAEQGELSGFVTNKKATAIAVVDEALKNAGITNLTAAQIDAAIEAAVKVNFNDSVIRDKFEGEVITP